MIMSDVSLKPYSNTLYHTEDLKSLSRYRFDKVSDRSKLKQSVSRLVNILFPELEKLVSTLHTKAVYELLSEFPGAHPIASANLKHLTALLSSASKGHFGRDIITFSNAAFTIWYACYTNSNHSERQRLDRRHERRQGVS